MKSAIDPTRAYTGLSTEETEILSAANNFARRELYPLAKRMDDEEWWPEEAFPKIGAAGFFGISTRGELGGSGLNIFATGLIAEAFSRWNYALALSWLGHENLCLDNIRRNGNESQKHKYLPGLCNGTLVGALGLTEPNAGSDALGSMRASARREGDHYLLNGTKIFITNGPVADVLLIYAKTDKDKGAHGISAFIVEKGFPGFRVAQKLVKMGFRGSQTGELVFENCKVPAQNLVGEENHGVGILMSGLDIERGAIALIGLGMAERALDLSVEYAQQRKQFNRPIAEFQMVRSKLASMYTDIEAMRGLAYRTLRACVTIGSDGGRGEVHKLTAASVLFVGEALNRVLNDAVQIHGGNGYMWETEINRLYRGNKLLEIGAGTSEVRRMIIAGELLRGG